MMNQEINITEPNNEKEISSAQSFSSEDINDIKEKSNILPEFDRSSLEGMNFAELQAMINSLKRSRDDAKVTMEYINEYKKMKVPLEELEKVLEETGNKKDHLDLFKLNGFQKDIEQFEKEYASMQEKTEKAISQLTDEILHRYGDVEKTSSFILDQMLELIEKKESNLLTQIQKIEDGNISDSEKLSKKMKIQSRQLQLHNMKMALNDRIEMNYWTNRFSNPQVVRKLWGEVSKNYDNAVKESIKYLCRYFKIDDLNTVRTTILLSSTCPGVQIIIGCIFYDLYKNLRYEKDSFKSWYARVFIMNILDYVQGVYDFHPEDNIWLPKYLGKIVKNIASYMFNLNQKEYAKICTSYLENHKDEYQEDLKRIEDFKKYANKEREKQIETTADKSPDGYSTKIVMTDELESPCKK